jgi:tRNA wybutosine-synthesizing protein 4
VVNGKVIDALPERASQRLLEKRAWCPGTVSYFEVDFAELVLRKRKAIERNRAMSALCGTGAPSPPSEFGCAAALVEEDEEEGDEDEDEDGGARVAAPATEAKATAPAPHAPLPDPATGPAFRYALVEADLRNVASLDAALAEAGLNRELPTLFLAECVLVYMPDAAASQLLRWAARGPGPTLFAAFEMVKPEDAFGQVMLRHLRARGCELHGMVSHPNLPAQRLRFSAAGFEDPGEGRPCAWDMLAVYDLFLDPAERRRVEDLELLDELEEWRLLMGHYCLALAANGPGCELSRYLASEFEPSD